MFPTVRRAGIRTDGEGWLRIKHTWKFRIPIQNKEEVKMHRKEDKEKSILTEEAQPAEGTRLLR